MPGHRVDPDFARDLFLLLDSILAVKRYWRIGNEGGSERWR